MLAFSTIKNYALTLAEHYSISQGKYNNYGKRRAFELQKAISQVEVPVEESQVTHQLAILAAKLASFVKAGQTNTDMKTSSTLFSLTRSSHTYPTSLRGMFLSIFTTQTADQKPIQTNSAATIQQNIADRMAALSCLNDLNKRNNLGLLEQKISIITQINSWMTTQSSYFGRSHGVKRAMDLVRKINETNSQKDLDLVTLKFLQTGITDVDKHSLCKPSSTNVTSLRGELIMWLCHGNIDGYNDIAGSLKSKSSLTVVAQKLGFTVYPELEAQQVKTPETEMTQTTIKLA